MPTIYWSKNSANGLKHLNRIQAYVCVLYQLKTGWKQVVETLNVCKHARAATPAKSLNLYSLFRWCKRPENVARHPKYEYCCQHYFIYYRHCPKRLAVTQFAKTLWDSKASNMLLSFYFTHILLSHVRHITRHLWDTWRYMSSGSWAKTYKYVGKTLLPIIFDITFRHNTCNCLSRANKFVHIIF